MKLRKKAEKENDNDKQAHIDNFLSKIYYNPSKPGSYYGINKLYNVVKNMANKPNYLDRNGVKEWLAKQVTHAIHSIPSHKFHTEHIITQYLNEQWDSDLIDIQSLSRYNDNVRYLLLCVDLFSRKIMMRPLKTKKTQEVTDQMEDIMDKEKVWPTVMRTDAGGEYVSKVFNALMKKHNISHFIAHGPHKASYAERCNLTMQRRIFKFLYETKQMRYIDRLQEFVDSYNETPHSVTSVAPSSVTVENSQELYNRVYLKIVNKRANTPVKFTFDVGEAVRITRGPEHFAKSYKPYYTEELFLIYSRIPSHPPRYRLVDLEKNVIIGSYYAEELQHAHVGNTDEISYVIEKILDTKKVNGVKYTKVKWLGYKNPTYVLTANIKNYKGKA